MKAFSAILGVVVLGSILSPVVTNADVARVKRHAEAQPLAVIERSVLATGNASYLHGAFAAAVGMKEASGAVSVFQREADLPNGGKLVAVTLVEIRGQKQILMATWTETEVHAFLTSSSGALKKAMRATKDAGVWTPMPVREAEKEFAAEKKFWLTSSDSAPQKTAASTPGR